MGRSLGKGMREFKDSVTGVEEAVSGTTTTTTPPPPAELPAAPSEPSPPMGEAAEETKRETVS
jgi:Sec-independent protein translocase protein TatA